MTKPQRPPVRWQPEVDPCAGKRATLDALLDQKKALENLIQHVSSEEQKNELRQQLKDVNVDVAAAQAAYQECRAVNPVPTEMKATFTGTGKVCNTYSDDCTTRPVTLTATFSPDRSTFSRISMEPIKGSEATAKLSNGDSTKGTYAKGSGAMAVPIDVAIDIHNPLGSDGSIHWDLTTGSASGGPYAVSGSPVDSNGTCKLVDVSQFSGGTLDGEWGSIELEGTWDPHPSTETTTADGRSRPLRPAAFKA